MRHPLTPTALPPSARNTNLMETQNVTNPFGTLATGGSWLSPKNIDGHLVIIANVKPIVNKYDDLAAANRDFATFDYADIDAPAPGWNLGITDNHIGIVNKLTTVAGVVGAPPVIGRIGQAETKKALKAWVLADVLGDPAQAAEVQRAAAWLAANPVPATTSPFAQAAAPAVAQVGTVLTQQAAPAQAQPQGNVADLLAALQANHQG